MPESGNQKILRNHQALEFNRGKEHALSFFYHEFYPALVHYSFQITQCRLVAEEVASDAFLKTWGMHYKLDSYAGIKAYLYKIVHRDSIEFSRKEQRKIKLLSGLPLKEHTHTPFELMVSSEVCRLVDAALKDLTPASRRVVVMHYLEGKPTRQIAKELNLHCSTIKTQKQQGLRALRKVFVRPLLWLLFVMLTNIPTFS